MTYFSNIDDELRVYIKAVSERKATDVTILDLKSRNSFADYFIICSAGSTRQAVAISDFIVSHLKKQKIKPINTEIPADGNWNLLDYGDVIIHIFYEPIRKFYDLEGLWADAEVIRI